MPDTIVAIQVDDHEFVSLAQFVKEQNLTKVPWHKVELGKYTVVVTKYDTVLRCFMRRRNQSTIQVEMSNRGGTRYSLFHNDIKELYQ